MTQGRLAWLDALRGWAAIVVAAFHVSPLVLGTPLHLRIFGVIDLGKYGVLLFFLVSGYVIPMSLERHGDLRRFWTGRLLRIYPAYLVAVVVALVLGAAGMMRMPPQLTSETTTVVLGHVTMLQDVLGTRGVLRPFWTLSFEMVFYLVVAGLFVWRRGDDAVRRRGDDAVRRRGDSLWWAAGLTVLAAAGLPDAVFGATPGSRRVVSTVAFLLVAGGLCAYLLGRRPLLRAAGAAGICTVALPLLNGHATDEVTSRSSAQAAQMLAVMFAGTVIYRVQHRQVRRPAAVLVLLLVATGVAVQVEPSVAVAVTATFALAWVMRTRSVPALLTRLGVISYSLYLLHIPVLAVVRRFTDEPLVTAVAFAAGSLTVAWAGHRWIERPAQLLARRVADPPPTRPASRSPSPVVSDSLPVASDSRAGRGQGPGDGGSGSFSDRVLPLRAPAATEGSGAGTGSFGKAGRSV